MPPRSKARQAVAPILALLILLCGVAGSTGCKKQEAPPPPPERTSSTSVSDLMGKKDEAPPPAAAPTPDAAQTSEAAPQKSSDGMPDREVIYAGIQKYMAEHHGRAAKGIEELVAGRYIPALPAPPSGKKYQLDQRFATLTVVDK